MRFWRVVWIGVAVVALCLAVQYSSPYWSYVAVWLHPPEAQGKTGILPLGGEILDRRERKDINRVSQEYGRVKVMVDVARSKGEDVSQLDGLLVYSLKLARQKRYDHAMTMLNRISISIPREKEKILVARPDDPLPKEPDLKARPLPKAKARPKPRRRPR